jgi:RimJ/RimL family protein N-acetyltransferase
VDDASALEWCRRMADWSAGDHATFHAVARSSGAFVGYVSFFAIDEEHGTAKVGYRIAPTSRGQRFGSEALAAATGWAFRELDLARIQLEHAVGNPASCAVAAAAGYRLEGVLRSSYRAPDGTRHDEHVHGRLASDAE